MERDAVGTTYIVAEVGTAHNGDLRRARRIVEAAADAGADCAKFQLVIADEIIHPLTGNVPLPGGDTPLYERFKELERPLDFYRQLKNITEGAGLDFLCTPFGTGSAALLRELGVRQVKIASPELNHVPLLRDIAAHDTRVILSSGVSTLSDIEEALSILGNNEVTLLHCVTAYPAPPEDYNVRIIPHLAALFGVPVGVSDHSLNPVIVPALAVACGARVVEKHITLSRADSGLDDPVALEPEPFRQMVEEIRLAEHRDTDATVSRLADRYGREPVESVLGSGRKQLAPSEAANYGRTNRSIHALRELHAGDCISSTDVGVLRTEKVLRPGLHPRHLDDLVGSRLARDIPPGQGVVWEDLLTSCR